MPGRKNRLNAKKASPALSAPKFRAEDYQEDIQRKTNRLYKIYLATTLMVVCLTVLFLIIGISENSSLNFEKISSFIISNQLLDLSGGASGTINSPTQDENNDIFDVNNGILIPSGDPDDSNTVVVPDKAPSENTPPLSIYDFDYSKVPEGETAIIPMDLSLSSGANTYIYNSTGYSPNTKALLASSFNSSSSSPIYIANKSAPLVLIVHTHGTEAYSKDGAISYLDDGSEIARSENISQNVVSVGAVMADILNRNGISTLHCTIMHDKIQYKDAYARAEATIKEYLAKYPSIKLVIDLHRDAVVKSTGELVRPVTLVDSQPTAQVMCVVGSDWGGEACPNWQNNLALALKLRDALNTKYENLCRPSYLRSSTYNQELAPFSLLLEVGASGNSLEEAKRAASLVAAELIPLIKMM